MIYPAVTAFVKHTLETDPFYSQIPPNKINNGNCEDFAILLQNQFPQGDVFWGDEISNEFNLSIYEPAFHCFFVYEGEDCQGETRYYDAECAEGVSSPIELPFFKRQYENQYA